MKKEVQTNRILIEKENEMKTQVLHSKAAMDMNNFMRKFKVWHS